MHVVAPLLLGGLALLRHGAAPAPWLKTTGPGAAAPAPPLPLLRRPLAAGGLGAADAHANASQASSAHPTSGAISEVNTELLGSAPPAVTIEPALWEIPFRMAFFLIPWILFFEFQAIIPLHPIYWTWFVISNIPFFIIWLISNIVGCIRKEPKPTCFGFVTVYDV